MPILRKCYWENFLRKVKNQEKHQHYHMEKTFLRQFAIFLTFGGKISRQKLYKPKMKTSPMASLKFTLGPVASGKTIDLILRANQLQTIEGSSHVFIFKPSIDTRFSKNVVKSASGLEIRITHRISPADDLTNIDFSGVTHVFVDEVQFFTVSQIRQLREISLSQNVEVHCYGLLNDFKTVIFEASKHLLELCDDFKQMKTYCFMCKPTSATSTPGLASHNLKITRQENGIKSVVDGESICIGGIDTFLPVCFDCYSKNTKTFV